MVVRGAIVAWGAAVARVPIVTGGSVVEAAAMERARWLGLGIIVGFGIELIELAHEVARFRELCEIDLAAPDQIEHELAELAEGILPTTMAANVIESRASFARAALECIAYHTCCRPEQRAEGATQLRRTKPAPSLGCHGDSLTSGLGSSPS
jgi:hypothetical protein